MSDLPPIPILLEIGASAALTGAALLVISAPGRGAEVPPGGRQRAAGALALAAGCLPAFVLLLDRLPGWPSRDLDVAEWPFWIALLALPVGLLLPGGAAGASVRVPAGSAVAAFAAFVLLRPVSGATAMVPTALVVAGAWLGLDTLALRRPGPTIPLVMCLAAGAGAVALLDARFAKGAQLAAAVAAAAGALLVATLCSHGVSLAHGGTLVFTALTTSLLTIGAFYAELPEESALLLAIAPLAAWIGELPPISRRPAALRLLVAAAAVSAPALLAIHLI